LPSKAPYNLVDARAAEVCLGAKAWVATDTSKRTRTETNVLDIMLIRVDRALIFCAKSKFVSRGGSRQVFPTCSSRRSSKKNSCRGTYTPHMQRLRTDSSMPQELCSSASRGVMSLFADPPQDAGFGCIHSLLLVVTRKIMMS